MAQIVDQALQVLQIIIPNRPCLTKYDMNRQTDLNITLDLVNFIILNFGWKADAIRRKKMDSHD